MSAPTTSTSTSAQPTMEATTPTRRRQQRAPSASAASVARTARSLCAGAVFWRAPVVVAAAAAGAREGAREPQLPPPEWLGRALDPLPIALLSLLLLLLLFLARLLYFALRKTPFPSRGRPVKTMVVLGSGGHTAEMLALLDHVDKSFYSPRVYVSAATDALSATKAAARERRWAGEAEEEEKPKTRRRQQPQPQPQQQFKCLTIPRSREVGQSWVTSAFTTARACLYAFFIIPRERPALLLANGPGTCVPLCAAAALWRALGVCGTRVAYVESVARVRRLSLSARLLRGLRLADVLLVQWPALAETSGGGGGGGGGGRAECVGRLF